MEFFDQQNSVRLDTPRTRVFNLIKDHVCRVIGRSDHREYLKFMGILNGLRNEQICSFQIDEVFKNEFTCKDNERVTILQYL